MSTEARLAFSERRKDLKIMQERYRKADRRERSRLLEEMEAVTGLHRKSLIRLMNASFPVERKPRRRERQPVYGPEVQYAVAQIARALDYPCAERLQPRLVPMAQHLHCHRVLRFEVDLVHHCGPTAGGEYVLREEIYDLIDQLLSLPGATPGVTEDVHLTLGLPSSLPEALLSPVTLSFDR